MGELLNRLVPDTSGWRMVASPLGRAQQTAGIICEAMGGALTPASTRAWPRPAWGPGTG
uniref:Uncharacterized protein n=1 Tax=Phenylobacterium glaciei TaxID=2803784 RepID=A0A974P5P8_9CAUL|nr:hypothetical protein JKL49_06310 [Phenylobacterium glaciei]